jgi:hypothetical protein
MSRFPVSAVHRAIAALLPAGVGVGLLYVLFVGLGVSAVVSTGMAVVLALSGAYWLWGRLPADLDCAPRNLARLALWAVLGLGAIGAKARLATFMADGSKVENSMYAFDEFYVHHSCLSAHFQAARLVRAGVPNIYERTHYEGPNGEPKLVDGFVIDVFLYPPPFLLLARLALAISENFLAWRAVWFALDGGLVAAALLTLALWIGGAIGRRAAWLSVLVWLSLPTLTSLQFGNFHLATIAGSIFAMLAFERSRHVLGGALLAALALSKVFPGILVLFLVFQRRWRAVAWTAGFGILFLAASYLILGPAPFQALLTYHLPRMANGAALETQFAHPDTFAANLAVYGLVQKLASLGVPLALPGDAVAATWLYTFMLIGISIVAARVADSVPQAESRLQRALVWLALVELASLRAPFTPDTYGLFAILWILSLLLAGVEWCGWRPIVLLGLVVVGNFLVPVVPIMPLAALLGLTLVIQVLFMTLCLSIVVGLGHRTDAQRTQGV